MPNGWPVGCSTETELTEGIDMKGFLFFSQPPSPIFRSICGHLWPERMLTVLLLVLAAFSLTNCATSVGVQANDPRETYAQISVSAISADEYSRFSEDVLTRYNLVQAFNEDPQQVLTFLHREAEKDHRNDLLFALAELNYFVGMRSRHQGIEQSRPHFFASTLYAYLYLLGKEWLEPPSAFDRRYRLACDVYNNALAEALTDADGNLQIAPAEVELQVGHFAFSLDTKKFHQEMAQFEKFVSTDRFGVRGLSRRNREAGMGAPIIAVEKKPVGAPLFRSSPATLFLRFNCQLKDLKPGACTGTLELYSAYDQTEIEVGDKKVPLERDVTAQLAYAIDQPYVQKLGLNEFLYGTSYIKAGLFYMQPYDPDKVPIVLVHGTFSSPIAWAEMANTLRADPVINRKYQIWNFFYDSGKRIGISAHELRNALEQQVQQLDPAGTNAALRKMVVIGHSQGGLLTKLTATDTGDAFVRAVTGKSLAQLDVSDEDRAHLEKESIFKPLPFVKRVIFISTPHRGSFLSKNWVRTLALKMITLPRGVLQSTANLMSTVGRLGVSEAHAQQSVSMTSLDVMAPSNPILQTLADIPLAPGVKGHSIVAIDGDETPPDGDDGVVKYTSAHVEYVESEFLVRAGHSCQGHPLVIEEVRRILLAHLKEHGKLPEKVH
jgi:pimeloyl-ACP methyl ester carboxylesterase